MDKKYINEKVKNHLKKNYTFYLGIDVVNRLEELSKETKQTKGNILSDLVMVFGDVYVEFYNLLSEYSSNLELMEEMSLDDYLKQNGFDFLFGKVTKNAKKS